MTTVDPDPGALERVRDELTARRRAAQRRRLPAAGNDVHALYAAARTALLRTLEAAG